MPKPAAKDLAVTPKGKVTTGPTRVATKPHPKLVNRGGAGLLHRSKAVGGELKPEEVPEKAELTKGQAKYRIAPALKPHIVKINTLTPDPDNAREHPDRNLNAIKDSLRLYGQVKPIVVRKSNRTVVAGNGTLESAIALGWTEIAAVFVDMNHVEAIGYGLADNRTAELAKWDFEVVARLDKILLEAGAETVGWTKDELEVLRAAEWIPPPVEEGGDDSSGMDQAVHTVKLTVSQQEALDKAAKAIRDRQPKGETKHLLGECIRLVCLEWLGEGEVEGTEAVEDEPECEPSTNGEEEQPEDDTVFNTEEEEAEEIEV